MSSSGEDLPDLDEECLVLVASAPNGINEFSDRLSLSGSDEEELPSLSNSPSGQQVGDEVQDLDSVASVPNSVQNNSDVHERSPDDELPSLSNSPAGQEAAENEEPEIVIMSVTGATGGDISEDVAAAAGGSSALMDESMAERNRGGPVRSFRTRFDEGGEVVFEFGSDDDDEDEEDPDYNPFGDASISNHPQPLPVPQQPTSSAQSIVRNIFGNNRVPARELPRGQVDFSHVESSSNSGFDNPDFETHANWSLAINEPAQVQLPQPNSVSRISTARQRPSAVRPQKNRRKQKRPKKRKTQKVKKPKVRKPRAPPKPLKPLVIYEDLPGNECVVTYRDKISSETKYKIAVNYYHRADLLPEDDTSNTVSPSKQKKVENRFSYKIGEVFLKDVGMNPWTSRNTEELLENFGGLVEFTIHVSEMPTLSVIKLKTEEKLSEAESASRPLSIKLGKKDLQRSRLVVLNKSYFFHFDPVGIPAEMFSNKGLGSKKQFSLDFVGFDEESKNLQFDLKLLQSAILGDHELSNIPYAQGQGILNVFSHFFKVDPPPKPLDEETRQKEDIAWFYGQLKKYHTLEVLPEPEFSIQPECFAPILRSYQKDAVRWMLFKEGVLNVNSSGPSSSKKVSPRLYLEDAFLQKMYIPVEIEVEADNQLELKPAYYNPYVGYVCWSKPNVPRFASGGMLCDEMGLGKTVEIICLILLNQKPHSTGDDADSQVVEVNSKNEGVLEHSIFEHDESSNDQEITIKSNKRSVTRKSQESRKRSKSSGKKIEIKTENNETTILRHPRLRKRKLSPCEFMSRTTNIQEETNSSEIDAMDINDPFPYSDDEYEDIGEGDSESDFEDQLPQNQKKSNGIKKKLAKGKKASSCQNDSVSMHPNRKRRRISPCEFSTDKSSVVSRRNSTPRRAKQTATDIIAEIVKCETLPSIPSAASSTSTKDNVTEFSKSSTSSPNKTGRKMSTSIEKGDKPITTYQGIKQIYDQVLQGYSETARAKVVPRFHGTFFDTSIRRRACFECICGGYNDDQRRVLTCTTCDSSQHAECVGFDKMVEKRMVLENKEYLCPHCAVMEKPYPAKTTLIITPNSISYQWINEIQRHVKDHQLNILFYKGVTIHGYIPPAKLAEYDIIITSYSVLSSELNYVDLPHCNSEEARQFRNAKRFLTIPSPLPCVLWWRVCLDEAQMVEGINTKMSMMAMKIQSIHRWCVTGTPINKGLQDLFGLFAFLGVQPISFDYWWDKLVQDPFHRKDVSLLYEIFGQLIWRTSKPDVLDQLGIPPQTNMSHWLRFSPVETHFYKQQYEICSNKILGKIGRLRQTGSNSILETRLSNLDRQTLQSLLQPFLELRQACCHPQMVKGQLISLQKGTLTMEELLAQLVKKTSLQCAEDHRLVVAALNGMAGIHMLREAWVAASEKYREVLQSAEKNKEHFHTDSLQLLHTQENLADLLDRHHDGVPFTLRDDTLRKEADDLKIKYMEKYAIGVKAAKDAAVPLSQTVEQLFDKFECDKQSWWAATLVKASSLNKIDDLIARIKDDLIDHTKKTNSVITLANKFNDSIGLQGILVESITQMESLRQSVLKGLEDLQQQDPSSFVHGAVCCHLRKKSQMYYKDTDSGFRCKLCLDHGTFLRYESILFKEEKKNKVFRTGRKWQQQKLMGVMATDLTEEEKNLALLREEDELLESLEHCNVLMSDALRRGTWGDSETERILKLINNFSRLNGLPSNVINDGNTHIKLFESMKKEFRVLRILWRQIYDQVSAVDELSQATTRLRLRDDNEEPVAGSSRPTSKKPKELKSGTTEDDQKIQNINVLERHELEMKLAQMQGDVDRGKDSLSIHLGQLLYLDTLKKNGYGKTGTSNADDCPICQNQLGMEWSVLRCGHSYCSECVKKMCPNTLHTFLCPLCRHAMKYADVSFVDTREPEESSVGKIETPLNKKDIRGSHSAKVEAILQTLFSLQETHPGEKAIIFSTWVDVLEIIAKALDQNDIPNCLLNKPGKHFQTNLNRFKTREDIQVLLMPITSGSKGLNIIEASHVLLVEPILNLASELQAIGRVHRIGQTKSTCVHRFYVKQTIEEQLFEILKAHDVSSDDEGSLTVAELQDLIRSGQNYA